MDKVLARDIASVQEGAKVVTAMTADSVADVLKKMTTAQVSAVPLMDANFTVLGFVDFLDIATFLIDKMNMTSAEAQKASLDDFVSTVATATLESTLREGVANRSATNPLVVLPATATAKDAFEHFSHGVHRLALQNADQVIDHILTQSEGVQYLAKERGLLGAAGERTLAELGLVRGEDSVVKIASSATALEAFMQMKKHYLVSLVVVDASGRVESVISASDLKAIEQLGFQSLQLPVGEFVEQSHKARGHLSRRFRVTASASSTLVDVLTLLVKEQVHRVVVIDDNVHPISVVTLSDISRSILKQ